MNARTSRTLALAATAALSMIAGAARADIVAQWNFNASNTAPSTADSHLLATPSAALVGGTTATFASGDAGTGSSDPVTPGDNAWNLTTFPSQLLNPKTAGARYSFNTTNFDVDSFSFDLRTSNTGSRFIQLQYTTDGSTWVDGTQFTSAGGDSWNNNLNFDLTGIAAADNNANFAIRVVSAFNPNAFTEVAGSRLANTAYQAAANDGRNYAGTGTWRFDMVTLNGAWTGGPFVPAALIWNNVNTTGTWDAVATNKPWLKSGSPSQFKQNAGQGDNVTFNDPANNTLVTIVAGGVTPNSTTITNNNTLTLTGGAIGGAGNLTKAGTGRLILATSNSFTSANAISSITAGVVETRASDALGTGPVSIANATWNATTAAQSFAGVVTLAGPVTIDNPVDLTISSGLSGSGNLTKIGAGTLAVGGISNNSGNYSFTAGKVRMDDMGALGGNASTGIPTGTITASSTELILNATGPNAFARTRLSGNITLSNVTVTRNQLTPGLGASPTNGDSEFASYYALNDPATYVGSLLSVSGSTTFTNLETRTAAASDLPGSGGSSNTLVFRMPVLVSAGSTLTLNATNGTLSNVGGLPTGTLPNTGVSLRSSSTAANSNDTVTLQAGATLAMTGAGEKRLGATSTGKPVIGLGTTASESTLKADARTFLTDQADIALAVTSVNSHLIVAGTGLGGLRVEAPMNAAYTLATSTSTTGLFGTNPDTAEGNFGNCYTILSPNRYAGLSGFTNSPTTTVTGDSFTRGGTLTLAATDAVGATGTIDNGPSSPTTIQLGLDNTATSGALIYNIDAAANSGAFANFGGLVLKRSGAAAVTTTLLTNASLNGAAAATAFTQLGGTFNLNAKTFSVPGAATLTGGNIVGTGGAFSAGAITVTASADIAAGVAVSTPGTLLVQTGATYTGPAFTAASAVLNGGAHLNLRPASGTTKVSALTIAGGTVPTATLDLSDNKLAIDYTGPSVLPTVVEQIKSGRNGYDGNVVTNWDGQGIVSSKARTDSVAAGFDLYSIGAINNADLADPNIGRDTYTSFGGVAVDDSSVLLRYTYAGDADLNGFVDGDDYALIDNAFNLLIPNFGWMSGDFNYDGNIDGDDYALIDSGFLFQGTPIPAAAASAVPEPTTLGVLALGAVGLLARRRRA